MKNRTMKKFITPILVLIGFFAFIYAILASTDHANNIALFGAGYAAFLVAIYTLIYSIKNPTYSYSMWRGLPDDATPAQHWGFGIGNFLTCMTVCWSTLELPEESLSDISIVHYASFPVFIAVVAFFVRRLIVKGK